MQQRISRALVLVGFVVLVRPMGAAGQSLAPARLTSAAEIGWRGFTKDLSQLQLGKFEEYQSTPGGLLLQQLLLGYVSADSSLRLGFSGYNVGESTQHLALRVNRPGQLDLQLRWDRIPHTFSTTARSFGSQPSPDVFLLPSPRPDTGAWNRSAPFIAPIRTRWDAVKAASTYTPTPHWDFKAEYLGMGKRGERPIGMAFGSPGANLREITEPIDQQVHDFKLSQSYTTGRFQLMGLYDLSLFRNAFTAVTSDNPLLITDSPTAGSSRGRIALAPDNIAHTAVLNGAFNLPLRTRVYSSVSYSWWKQDAAFIPITINSAINDPRMAALPTNLGGATGTSNASVSATSHPLAPVTVTAKYRSFSYRDDTRLDSIPLLIVNDRSISPAAERERFPHTRKNADVSVSWRLQQAPVVLSAGYGWDYWTRDPDTRNVYRTGEDAVRGSIDVNASNWLSVRTTFSKAQRRAHDPYIQNTPADLPEHRRFDQADRDRRRVNVLFLVTPIDALALSGSWGIGRDAYPASAYGLQRDRSWLAGADVSWSPSARFSIDAGYTRESFLTRLRSRYRVTGMLDNRTYDWVANTRDHIATTTAGFRVEVLPDRLEAGARFEQSRARYTMATYNPVTPTGGTASQNFAATATDLPQISQKLQPMSFYAHFKYSDSWGATLRFQTERYDQNDFRTANQLPAEGNGIFLGNDFRGYDARFLTFSLEYRRLPPRIARSAL